MIVTLLTTSTAPSVMADEPARQPIRHIRPDAPHLAAPDYKGERYAARVPDTLDLAERAALAVNGLTGPTDPEADYEIYCMVRLVHNPPYMWHDFSDHAQIKFMEALPLMRLASGSRQNLEVDRRWFQVLVQMQGTDGLLYYPFAGRPWARLNHPTDQFGPMPEGDHYCEPYANGRLLGAIGIYYQLTGDERWKRLGEGIVDGLARQAIQKDDYAYFTKGLFAVNEVSDPNVPIDSINLWTNMTFGWVVMGLAQFYDATGYAPALELSGKLARYIRVHGQLYDREGRFINLSMHFHGHTYPLLGMLEYATAAGDEEMVQFVRKGFEFARSGMHPMIGFVPELMNPDEYQHSETCGVADMVALGLKLTRAGVGDYWDDVDRWTRNQLAECQLTDIGWVKPLVESRPEELKDIAGPGFSFERVAERSLGGFAGWPTANDWQGKMHEWQGVANQGLSIMHCCTGNGARAIYYVWSNTLTHRPGRLNVNLLLNRASPWADIDSRIPYEGRVDVKMKEASDLAIRIPEWTEPRDIRCTVNEIEFKPEWDGRYALIAARQIGDQITLEFPLPQRTDTLTINKEKFTFTRKGNDVVRVEPPGHFFPLYQREHYHNNETRWRMGERFVAQRQIDW